MKKTLRFQTVILAAWLLAFGLPFVVITDLFPLHRFGMFARMPNPGEEVQLFSIEVKVGNEPWKTLLTGNPYFDKSYFYHLASDAFGKKEKSSALADKLRRTLSPQPDSIRLVKEVLNAEIQTVVIYPTH